MSDPVTNVEIEDVLSSIRRLVSEEARPPRSKPEVARAVPDRLVLTPSLRVQDEDTPVKPEPRSAAGSASDRILLTNPAGVVPLMDETTKPEPDDPEAATVESESTAPADAGHETGPEALAPDDVQPEREADTAGLVHAWQGTEAASQAEDAPTVEASPGRIEAASPLASDPDEGAGTAEPAGSPVAEGSGARDSARSFFDETPADRAAEEQPPHRTPVLDLQAYAPEAAEHDVVDDEHHPDTEGRNGTLARLVGEEVARTFSADLAEEHEEDHATPSSSFPKEQSFASDQDAAQDADPAPSATLTLSEIFAATAGDLDAQSKDSTQRADDPFAETSVQDAAETSALDALIAEASRPKPVLDAAQPTSGGAAPERPSDDETAKPTTFPDSLTEQAKAGPDRWADGSMHDATVEPDSSDAVSNPGDRPFQSSVEVGTGAAPGWALAEGPTSLHSKIAALEKLLGRDKPSPAQDGAEDSAERPTFQRSTSERALDWEDHRPVPGAPADDLGAQGVGTAKAADGFDPVQTRRDIDAEAEGEAAFSSSDKGTVAPQGAEAIGAHGHDTGGALTAHAAIDEEVLRQLVSDIVRQELQGVLGERITRNVRKLVRREIHRVVMSQEFD